MTTATAVRNSASSPDAAAAATTRSGADGSSPAVTRGASLYEKLAAITKAVQIKATGRNEQGGKAMSIADVEKAIGDLCGEHGVITRWTLVELDSYDQPTKSGSMRMWRSHLRVKVINADLPDESFEDEWTDIGTNPMAAASFVRKGYYRALFHLADEADEAKGVEPAEGGRAAVERAFPAPASPLPPARSGNGASANRPLGPCPTCAELQITNRKGHPGAFWPARVPGRPVTCDGYEGGEYVNHRMPESEPEVTADVSPDSDGKLPWE